MSDILLKLNDRDERLIRDYTKSNNLSIAEFIRKVIIEN